MKKLGVILAILLALSVALPTLAASSWPVNGSPITIDAPEQIPNTGQTVRIQVKLAPGSGAWMFRANAIPTGMELIRKEGGYPTATESDVYLTDAGDEQNQESWNSTTLTFEITAAAGEDVSLSWEEAYAIYDGDSFADLSIPAWTGKVGAAATLPVLPTPNPTYAPTAVPSPVETPLPSEDPAGAWGGKEPATLTSSASAVAAGQTFTVTAQIAPELGASAVRGNIEVQGLQIVSVSTSLSDDYSLFLIPSASNLEYLTTATYTCRVTANPGEHVSFRVSDMTVVAEEKYYTAQPLVWEATVAGETAPTTMPTAAPTPTPDANGLPQGVTINAGSPVRIEREDANSYLYGYDAAAAKSPVTVQTLTSQFTIENTADAPHLTVTKDRNTLNADQTIGTGCVLNVMSSADARMFSATVVMYGDVTGTGIMSITQLVRLTRAFRGTDPLEGPYFLAGDVNGSGRIDLTDLTRVAAFLREVMSW